MSVAEIFEGIEAAKLAEQIESWQAYRELVRDLANGETIDPGEAAAVLSMVHKSRENLETDLDLYRERLAIVPVMERGPAASIELAEAQRELAEKRAQVDEAISRMNAEIAVIEARVRAANHAVMAAAKAERQLEITCLDPVISQKEKQVMKGRLPLAQRRGELEEEISRYRANVTRLENLKQRLPKVESHMRRDMQQEIARGEGIVQRERNALADAESQLRDVFSSLAELDRQWNELAIEKRKA